MRLDQLLKWSRVIPRRPLAKATCDAGRVQVNGQPARAGRDIREGDVVIVRLPHRVLTFRVVSVPAHAPGKSQARDIIEVQKTIGIDRLEPDL